jgi:hypothetical protein
MMTYRTDLARGWLLENWLWFAKTFSLAMKHGMPVEMTVCHTHEQNDPNPRRISLIARTELPPDREFAGIYLRSERVPECLEKYGEVRLLRQWKGWNVLARIVNALDRNLASGDTRFLDRLSAWVEAEPETMKPPDPRGAGS